MPTCWRTVLKNMHFTLFGLGFSILSLYFFFSNLWDPIRSSDLGSNSTHGESHTPWREPELNSLNTTSIKQHYPKLFMALQDPKSPKVLLTNLTWPAPLLYHASTGFTGGSHGNISLLLYNRVPKCGSTAIRKVLDILSKQNRFQFVSSQTYRTYRIDNKEQGILMNDIKHMHHPLIYERHIHFLNFTRFGERQPPYFNVIRDPLDRMVSWYYFIRFQTGHIQNMTSERRNMTFDQCVFSGHPDCLSSSSWFQIIPFFCGQDSFCQDPTPASLARAKSNVEQYYLIVGLTEDLHGFMEAAEYLIPQYFKNSSAIFNKMEENLFDNYHTKKKSQPFYSTKQIMKARMAIEYELYYYVKQRFYILMHNIHKMKFQGSF